LKYFKNTELAELYNVSEKTVRNWIQAAYRGNLDLELYDKGNAFHIADTAQNTFLIEQLVKKGKKYKNTRGKKAVTPASEFYDTYSLSEIYDIISHIDIHREIPHKYSYYAEGAKAWDEYVQKQVSDPFPGALTYTINLLELSSTYLDKLLDGYTGVNVVDLGVGNAYPVQNLLRHLLDKNLLHRYVAVDASQDMIDIAHENIEKWFGDSVPFEKHLLDINYDKFSHLLASDSFTPKNTSILNFVLFLGGTIVNLRDPDLALRNIYNSLGKDDIFVISRKLDTPQARRFFDFHTPVPEKGELSDQERVIPDLLGIDESFYTVEQFFDKGLTQRTIQMRLKVDLSITFKLEDRYRVLDLHKGEAVLVWRAYHHDLLHAIDQLSRNGLETIQATKTTDQQYAQLITKIRPKISD